MHTVPFTQFRNQECSSLAPQAATSQVFSEILRAARLLMAPGAVHELRVPQAGRLGTISGYFDNPEALACAATRLDGLHPGIYITLNPCRPELLARSCNRIQPHAHVTTSDHDIARRRWLFIDCDPRRPAGISSSDREHSRAIATACGIWDDLRGPGFPDPVVADSGNGAHLLYLVDLSNSPEATNTVQGILKGVAIRCAPDDIEIDVSVYNAARICKLYGTLVKKGDSTADRPHRRSRILEIPERLEALRLEAK
jgi:hypothetical protein